MAGLVVQGLAAFRTWFSRRLFFEAGEAADYLEDQVGARGLVAMRAIKSALDPDGILNPGKVLPD